MKIRTYEKTDKGAILRIFRSNCPKYFDPNDEQDLVFFLDNYADENYLVAVENDQVIGCGGHYTKNEQHGIAWVMFDSGSIGHRRLMKVAQWFYGEIEQRIFAEGQLYDIHINTTQLMEKLFGRFGFETREVIPDGFGDGLHEYRMVKRLSEAN